VFNFEDLRPISNYPKYPPYVKDDNGYLESFFFNYYINNKKIFDDKDRTLLPIWWTTLAVDNVQLPIQKYIDVLPSNIKWFTVSQLDDGIKFKLPPNTLHFAAGGLGGGIPIPLICSPIPKLDCVVDSTGEQREIDLSKSIFCSFVGSVTHPIRQKIIDYNKNQTLIKNTFFLPKNQWSQHVSDNHLQDFQVVTQASQFALAPRGYGLSSFRLYEIMQLGAIPVYVSDKHWLPFTDELDWNEFCVLLGEKDIPNLYEILLNISPEKQERMFQKGKEVYESHFTLESVCKQILKRL